VGALAIGKAGAINAALLATAILGCKHPAFRRAYAQFRARQTARVLANQRISNAQLAMLNAKPKRRRTPDARVST
jgi:phosphoribosylcarboxyaminoimidazole (NCAIR) mutase